ncbi:hypothetical protein [Synechococcus sp. PCC 7336]|uniref:hypothetical protein n=1 Tax=Synechococcus sp. PCC 7336 TaxID=195250 RepID=UPI00034B1E78|nr:hypothetical protein [Synechococcus sp. PCC 7336]
MTEPNNQLLQELEQLTAIAWTLATAMEVEEADRSYRLAIQHIIQGLKQLCDRLKQEAERESS